MDTATIIEKTIDFVKKELADAEGGHDRWHIYRVWENAQYIAQYEKVDKLIVELGALLHDIADHKFHNGDEQIGAHKTRVFLTTLDVDTAIIDHVANIVMHVSFKGGHNTQQFHSPELAVVQDADRLDAMGAIGIARTFSYSGYTGRAIYDPKIKPNLNMTKEEYKNSTAPAINHFYEKLLLLTDRMNTQTGKAMAAHRHAFMEQFLDEFYQEWEGKK